TLPRNAVHLEAGLRHGPATDPVRQVAERAGQGLTEGVLEHAARAGPRRRQRPRGVLEQKDAAWGQDPYEFPDRAAGLTRRRVLEGDQREGEVERAVVEGKSGGFDEMITAAVRMAVVSAGERDHGRRDVHAVSLTETLRQGLRQTPDAAAEIERPARLR